MTDEDDGDGPARGQPDHELLEPGEAPRVEVVGGLVEQDDVGLAVGGGHGRGDREAFTPPSRERRGGLAHQLFGETDLAEEDLGEHLRLVRFGVLTALGDPVEPGPRDHGPGIEALREDVLLGHEGGVHGPVRADLAPVGLELAREELEEGAFARAVRPDDAEAIARVDGQ